MQQLRRHQVEAVEAGKLVLRIEGGVDKRRAFEGRLERQELGPTRGELLASLSKRLQLAPAANQAQASSKERNSGISSGLDPAG